MTACDDSADIDTGGLKPLCNEAEFAEMVDELVHSTAPRLFALVEECGERADGWIVAWGMQFDDHAEVIASDRGLRLGVASAQRAREMLARLGTIRLVWYRHESVATACDAGTRIW